MVRIIPYLCIFAMFAVIAIASTALATEMSSKRDCAICHVMWLNDFRTEKQTLIEWQPENVLMKDTQGVVSSEEICYSCHDGYVNDSRHVVWKDNQHKTFVKPSGNVTVPAVLPLSNRNEIYCGTCHSAHGAGAAPADGGSGMTSFFREKNVDSSLCEMCHVNEADYQRTKGHPLKEASHGLPGSLFEMGGVPGKDKNKVICQSCHKVHGAKGDKIAVVGNQNSTLCITCHDSQKGLIGTKHDLRRSLPEAQNIKAQKASASGPCGACHAPHNSLGKRLWARDLDAGNLASRMCLTCHAEKTGSGTKSIGRHSHPINVEPYSKTSTTSKLPLYSAALKKNPKGRIQCFTCHEVHQWDPESLHKKGGLDVEGNASNSFLRISNSFSSALCLECHSDKKQLGTSDHNLSVTAPDEKNLLGFTAGVSGPCGACHVPHNAAGSRLWAKQISGDKDFVTQMCTGCHSKNGAAKAKLIGDKYHPVNVAFKRSNIAGAEEYADTKLPLYDKDGNRRPHANIVCMTCHEPHIWNSEKSGALSDYAAANMEGDAADSFLRKANFPKSGLCKDCHAGKALVDGTVHDLSISAPEETNLLGQTVNSSGTCGACHLVHNSPSALKLWARPYGPIAENENISSALCTSCHSKGKIAANKIPLIATHPEGKLVNNIIRYKREKRNYTLIFDKYGNEVNFGNIACPSCHNAHKWSNDAKKVTDNPGGELKGKFLRVKVYDIICIDCHGPDALLKYQNFHDPDKRGKSISR